MVTYSLENRSIINLYVYTGLDNDVSIIPIMVGYCPLKFTCSTGEISHIPWVFFFHYRNGSFWPQHFHWSDFTSNVWSKLKAQSCGALQTRYVKSRRLAMPLSLNTAAVPEISLKNPEILCSTLGHRLLWNTMKRWPSSSLAVCL